MKTKFIRLFLVLSFTLSARADIVPVDTVTPHGVGGSTITGDPLVTAFTKLNSSIGWLKNYCDTNGVTNASLAFQLNVLTTNLLNTSNLVVGVQTNLNGVAAQTLPLVTSVGTNMLNLNYVSNLVVNFDGNHIQTGTINSNRLDAATLLWLQSCDVAGVLADNASSTGTGGYVAKANGDGTWTWGAASGGSFPSITDDGASPGHVGINNPSPGYAMDVTGSGYITAELIGADQNRSAFLFGSQANGVQYEFGIDSAFDGGHDFYIYDSANGGFIMQIDASHNTIFGGNLSAPGTLNSDNGYFYTDGSGDVTAQSFNPLSDRTLKENIQALDPAKALSMALALTNSQWQFKARTNLVTLASRRTATNSASLTTNQVSRITPASGRQFGPMAQDWHQVTGLDDGHHISLTAMNGLLLGAVQGLDQKLAADKDFPRIPVYSPPHSASTTFGYGAGLLTCDANNLYVSIGTNAWSRVSLSTNGW